MKVVGSTYLSNRGFAIEQKGNEKIIEKLKEELTVCPKVNPSAIGAGEVVHFPVYRENEEKFYLPKFFGLQRFGAPTKNTIKDGIDAPRLIFKGEIRPEQEAPVNAFVEAAKDPKKMGGIISLPCGAGKCLAKNTPILMYDGTIKMVQNVKVGEFLMGDDSTPRTVLSTCTGKEEMFDIIPTKGDTYTVNRSHILSLKCSTNHSKTLQKGTIVDISVDDYLNLPTSYHGDEGVLYGYRTGVDFLTTEVSIDPYLVGYCLGGGISSNPVIKSMTTKEIPHIYKCNSQQIRLQVLAGFIDANGSYNNYGFDIVLKTEKLTDDIIYIARSLGFAAYKEEYHKSSTDNYYYTTIFGKDIDKIPTKVMRKPDARFLQMDDVLMTHIKAKTIGMGTYYGFEIDGNHRFLLGDFTVTHNTVCGLYIASQFKKKTLIVCHKDFLGNQWKERIVQFLPDARIGIIKQKKIDIADKDIVIASLQSIAMRTYEESIFKEFGFVIFDEAHHLSAEVFSQCLPKTTCRIMLGLSATLKRKDGLSKVFEWYLGKPVYQIKREDNDLKVLVKRYYDPTPEYSKEVKMYWNGKLNVAKMINNVCEFPPRNYMIIETLVEVLLREPERQVLILSERRNHLLELEILLKLKDITSIGYYIGGMRQVDLDKSSQKQILLGTFQLAQEGMDVPTLNTLILASPVSSIEQAIGRIQRQKKEVRKYQPLVIDILDEFSMFEGQGRKRLAFYTKNNYEIMDAVKEKLEKDKDTKYCFIEDPDDS